MIPGILVINIIGIGDQQCTNQDKQKEIHCLARIVWGQGMFLRAGYNETLFPKKETNLTTIVR